MKARTAVWFAWALFGLGMSLTAIALILGISRGHAGEGLVYFPDDLIWLLSLASFIPVGTLIAWRHPRNPVGWIILAIGLSEVSSKFAYEYAAYSLILNPGSLPGGDALAWVSSFIWAPELGLFPFMILLFPNGRSLSRRWSWVGWLSVAWLVVFAGFAAALWPYRGARFLRDVDSFRVEQLATAEDIVFALFPVVMLCLTISLVSLIIRFRRSHGEERQQLKWIALVATLGATSIVVNDLVLGSLGIASDTVQLVSESIGGPGTFAIAAGIAMFKYRLYDIDLIINRALVYGALTAMLGLTYVALVAALSSFAGDSPLAVAAATLMVAALFQPLRRQVQSFIDRRFYRHKYDATKTWTRSAPGCATRSTSRACPPSSWEQCNKSCSPRTCRCGFGRGMVKGSSRPNGRGLAGPRAWLPESVSRRLSARAPVVSDPAQLSSR